ncbi:porin [Acidovorax cattleyae]|uniref:porin n=1 Tax=Paracidovorax cattleyae TaxID=80868 RepID=UPI0018AF8E52|nr:porin [Paracidovorax cattleyae]
MHFRKYGRFFPAKSSITQSKPILAENSMKAANAPSPSSAAGIASGVDNTSRFGLRGREDLGGGLHAVFNLETGLNLDTGTQANATKFFDRATIVGLGGRWARTPRAPTCDPPAARAWPMRRAGGLTVSGAYQDFKTASGLALDAATLGVAYQFGSVKLLANTGRSKAETSATARTVQRVHSVGGTWAATPAIDLTASVYRLDRDRSGLQGDGYTRAILFAECKLSRRSRLYAELDRTNWRGGYQGAANKSAATGFTAGVMHTF